MLAAADGDPAASPGFPWAVSDVPVDEEANRDQHESYIVYGSKNDSSHMACEYKSFREFAREIRSTIVTRAREVAS